MPVNLIVKSLSETILKKNLMILSLANELPAFSKSEKVFEPWENVNPGTNSFGVNDKETSVLNSKFNNQQNKQNEGMCVIKRNGRQTNKCFTIFLPSIRT